MSNPTPPKQIIRRQPGKHISDTPPDHRCWEIAELRDALAAAHLGRDKAEREREELRTAAASLVVAVESYAQTNGWIELSEGIIGGTERLKALLPAVAPSTTQEKR